MRLNIKPLSVNEAWKGRRFKTDKYKAYELEVCYRLNPLKIPEGNLEILLTFGFSSSLSDFDNPVKPFVDCLQKKYRFNDNRIKRATIEVVKVKKGDEFIDWRINELNFNVNQARHFSEKIINK